MTNLKNLSKRMLSVLLCMVMLLTVFLSAPFTASAASYSFEVDGVRYLELDDSTVSVVGYNWEAPPKGLIIPSTIQEKTVVSISNNAFERCSSLESVTILAQIKTIPDSCFDGCKSLKTVNMPSVENIERSAFWGCSSLESFDFSNIKQMGNYAFERCSSLESITLPQQLTTIPESCFRGCTNLKTLNIPYVEILEDYAFDSCKSLKSFDFSNIKKMSYGVFNDCSSLESVSLPERFTTIPPYTFGSCTSLKTLDIPSVDTVGERAFEDCTSLASFDFSNIKKIGYGAFDGCSLFESVIFDEDAVCTFGGSVFSDCKALKEVKLPNNVTEIPDNMFQYCTALETLETGNITKVGSFAFEDCENLKNLSFATKNNITYIEEYAFNNCYLLTEFSAPKATTLEIGVFENCYSLRKMTLGNSLRHIADNAFLNCYSLEKVTLGDNLRSVYEKAFYNCISLSEIYIPNSVEEIGAYAFACFDYEEEDGTDATYVFTDFIVRGTKNSLADEYAEAYGVRWELPIPKLTSISNIKAGVKLSFNKISGLSGKYRIYRKTEGTSWQKIADTTSSSYTDTTAKSGTKYTYTVRFIGKSETSEYDTDGLTIVRLSTPEVKDIENTTTGAKITWGKVTGAAEYTVRVKSGSSWKIIGTTSSTSFTHTTASSGKTYTYTVRAHDSSDEYESGYITAGWDNKFIASPKISSVTNTSTGAKISWGKVSGASKYRVFVKSGSSWKKLGDTTSTSYTHTSASSGKTYTYTVRCTSSTGKSYTSAYDTKGTANTFVKRPSISSITNTVDGPKISWSKVSGAKKYNVLVKSGSSWKVLGTTQSSSFVHSTAASGKTYTYSLRCVDENGENISAYNTTGWSNKYIAAPKITSVANTSKGPKITWGKVSGAVQYRVFVKSGSSWKKLKDTTSTSYTHTTAKNGKTYTYTVRCISSTGKSYTSGYDTTGKSIVCEK